MSHMKHILAPVLPITILAGCQDRTRDGLFPGEFNDPAYRVPIIAAVIDTVCSDSVECPSTGRACVTRTFQVQKDTRTF